MEIFLKKKTKIFSLLAQKREAAHRKSIIELCYQENTEEVKRAIEYSEQRAFEKLGGMSPLYFCCMNGNFKPMEFLIDWTKVDVNEKFQQKTPLQIALQNGSLKNVEKLLLHEKIDLNGIDMNKLLILTCENGWTSVFNKLRKIPEVNSNLQENGEHFLMTSMNNGSLEISDIFVEEQICHYNKQEVFYLACVRGYSKIVKHLLEEKFNPNYEINGQSPFSKAYENSDLHILTYFFLSGHIPETEINYDQLFLQACINCELPLIDYLIDQKLVDPSRPCSNGQTPIQIALSNGDLFLLNLLYNCPQVEKSIQEKNEHFSLACKLGSQECVQQLLHDTDINVNERATWNNFISPFYVSILEKNIEVAILILELSEKKVNTQFFYESKTALELASELKLERLSKKIEQYDSDGLNFLFLSFLSFFFFFIKK